MIPNLNSSGISKFVILNHYHDKKLIEMVLAHPFPKCTKHNFPL